MASAFADADAESTYHSSSSSNNLVGVLMMYYVMSLQYFSLQMYTLFLGDTVGTIL